MPLPGAASASHQLSIATNIALYLKYEITSSIEEAILREKKLKNWHREWKINLIKKFNPEFKDLSEDIFKEQYYFNPVGQILKQHRCTNKL